MRSASGFHRPRSRPSTGVARLHRSLAGAAFLLVVAASPALAQVVTTFDSDLEGWTITGDNVYFRNPTDGNPDGCLEVQDAASGPWSVASAPAAYLGNWADFTPADSLSYDAIHLPASGQNGNPPYVFRIEGPGGAAEYRPSPFPADVWNHLAAPIEPAAWTLIQGAWTDLLSNVTSLTVAAEMISGDEVDRLDNIRLSGTPGTPATDCATERFEAGIVGWAGQVASIARVTTDGDIGSHLRVIETGAGARVLAPTWFGGDWSGFDGTGSISFSLTFITTTVEPGREIRVEIRGPGGSAFGSEPSDDFLPVTRFWLPLSWPITESAWTVTSGTWAGLLANVTEVLISADVSAGNDRYGLDNVARGIPGCTADPPLPLVLHEPGYSVCGSFPFRDGSALALDPADGELYALVNDTVANGGGVYRISGPGAGVRLHSYTLPLGLVFTADGDGFVSENNSGVLYRFVGADSSVVWGSTFHAGDDDIAGMVVAPPGFEGPNVTAGDIIIADHGNGGPDEIWATSPDSANGERGFVPDPGNVDWYDLATDGTVVWAADALDPDGLWVIHPDGTTSVLALSQNVAGKRALAYDAGTRMLYTLKTTTPIGLYRIDPADGRVTLIADGFSGVGYDNLEIDPVTRTLWVADNSQSRIWAMCLPPSVVAAGEPAVNARPFSLALRPHPVVHGTSLVLQLPRASRVDVEIVDAAGRRVRRLDPALRPAGAAVLPWDGRDAAGRPVAAGVYFVRATADGQVCTRKAVVLH